MRTIWSWAAPLTFLPAAPRASQGAHGPCQHCEVVPGVTCAQQAAHCLQVLRCTVTLNEVARHAWMAHVNVQEGAQMQECISLPVLAYLPQHQPLLWPQHPRHIVRLLAKQPHLHARWTRLLMQ